MIIFPLMSSRNFQFVLLGLSFIVLSSTSAVVHPASAATSWISTISGFAFHPASATLLQGVNATWTNNDLVVYTLWFTNATNGSTYLLSSPISPGASWSHVFNSPALLKYYDFDRLWINGSLNILPPSTIGGAVVSADKPALLAPYFGSALVAAAALVAAFHLKNAKRKNSNKG